MSARTPRGTAVATWLLTFLLPVALTAGLVLWGKPRDARFLYLLLVLGLGLWRGLWPALACTAESALILALFYFTPVGPQAIQHRANQIDLVEVGSLALAFTLLADQQRRSRLAADQRLQLSSDLAADLASASLQVDQVTDRILRRAGEVLRATSTSLVHHEGDASVVEHSYPRDGEGERPGTRLIQSSRARKALQKRRRAFVRQPDVKGGIGQLAEVPLWTGGDRPLSLLVKRGWWPRFQAGDVRMMRNVASVGSLAIQNATLRERREAALVEVGRVALSLVPGRELLQVAVDILARTLDVELAAVAEVRADGQTALLRAGHGLKPDLVDAVLPAIPGTPLRYLIRTDDECQVSELLRDHGVVSGISTLVRVGGVLVTELGAFSTRPRAFSQDDRQFLEHVGNLISQALITIRANDALEESLEQLRRTDRARRELLGRLVTAVEDERAKIARDIHDDALQVLAGIALRLHILMDEITDEDQRRLLERLLPALDETMHRLRTLIFDLRADVLDEGLAVALRLYLDQVRGPDGPDCTLVSRLPVEPPMETRRVVYRIAQEALSNVRKHAGASHVEVVLESGDGGVHGTIRDDGRGFDLAEAQGIPGHLGLVAMRERAQLAGGELRIESAPGRGTTIDFWIPVTTATP